MTLMTGSCPKCGVTYCGWALTNPAFQQCEKCGGALEIFKDGVRVINSNNTGYGFRKKYSRQESKGRNNYIEVRDYK